MHPFFTPWKHQKTVFSGDRERVNWEQTSYINYNEKPSHFLAFFKSVALHKLYPNMEFFWSAFYRIRTEYRDLLYKSLHSVWMCENTDILKNSISGHFSRCVNVVAKMIPEIFEIILFTQSLKKLTSVFRICVTGNGNGDGMGGGDANSLYLRISQNIFSPRFIVPV